MAHQLAPDLWAFVHGRSLHVLAQLCPGLHLERHDPCPSPSVQPYLPSQLQPDVPSNRLHCRDHYLLVLVVARLACRHSGLCLGRVQSLYQNLYRGHFVLHAWALQPLAVHLALVVVPAQQPS